MFIQLDEFIINISDISHIEHGNYDTYPYNTIFFKNDSHIFISEEAYIKLIDILNKNMLFISEKEYKFDFL